MITYSQPASKSMAGATSPVYAPLSSLNTSWAARRTGLPSMTSDTAARAVNTGATTISPPRAPRVPSTIARASARDSSMLLCIFQLPASIHLLMSASAGLEGLYRRHGLPFEQLEESAATGRYVGNPVRLSCPVYGSVRIAAAHDGEGMAGRDKNDQP